MRILYYTDSLVLKRSGKARVTVVARSNFEAVESESVLKIRILNM